MLEKLLAEIRSGGTFEIGALAQRLGTSPELVSAMLDHLDRMGKLHLYQTCDSGCGGCGLKGECSSAGQAGKVRLWQG